MTDIHRHVLCLLNNTNIVWINKNANIIQLFSYVNKFIYFLLDFVSIVAKVTKFVQEYHIQISRSPYKS